MLKGLNYVTKLNEPCVFSQKKSPIMITLHLYTIRGVFSDRSNARVVTIGDAHCGERVVLAIRQTVADTGFLRYCFKPYVTVFIH